MSRETYSSISAAATRRPTKIPQTPNSIVSVQRGPKVTKAHSLKEICSLRVSEETYNTTKAPLQCIRCQTFGRTQWYCGYAPGSVACGEDLLSGECSTSQQQQQIKHCRCGENHTANFLGCVKWKDALTERSEVGVPHIPPIAPKTKS